MSVRTSLPFLLLLSACSSNLQPPTHSVPATGGASGTGGVVATGGTVGPDGSPTGGQGGYMYNGNVCSSLANWYQAAMAVARICDAQADGGGQCGVLATAALPASGCLNGCDNVWVNDDTELTAIMQQWFAAGCQGVGACPQLSCVAPPGGQCAAGGDGGQGLCQTLVWLAI